MFTKINKSIKKLIKVLAERRVVLCAFTVMVAAAIIVPCFSLNAVVINDKNGSFTYKTIFTDPDKILDAAGVVLQNTDKYVYTTTSEIAVIDIKRSFPVTLTVGDYRSEIYMTDGTVSEAIQLAGIVLDEHDLVNYELGFKLTADAIIDITNIDFVYETSTEEIPFENNTLYSSRFNSGIKTVSSNGIKGEKEITYCKKIINGIVTEVSIVDENITREATAQTTVIGTKTETPVVTTVNGVKTSADVKMISSLLPTSPIALDANGKPVNYSKLITGKGTAYSTTNPNAKCSTGVKPRTGYVAVNPKQIPYGTKLYIVSSDGKYHYGYAIAADTGGFATNGSGTVIDLFFNSSAECYSFGRRNVEVYVLN